MNLILIIGTKLKDNQLAKLFGADADLGNYELLPGKAKKGQELIRPPAKQPEVVTVKTAARADALLRAPRVVAVRVLDPRIE